MLLVPNYISGSVSMLNVIKADASAFGEPGNRPGSVSAPGSTYISVKLAILGFICRVPANYCVMHLVLVIVILKQIMGNYTF